MTLFLVIPPCHISGIIKAFSNTQTEIIALCHAIIQIHQLVMVANNVSVEVVHAHSVDYLSSIGWNGSGVKRLTH